MTTPLLIGTIDPLCTTVLRLSLVALFLSSALHKARAAAAFRAAVAGYDLLPSTWVNTGARVALGGELLIGLALLVPAFHGAAAVAAIVVLGVYSAAVAINLYRGRSAIDCGCGGPAGRMPISRVLLARNALLMGACVVAALPPTTRSLDLGDVMVICAAVLTAALLYAAGETAMANAARARLWRSRVTALPVPA